MADEGVYLFCFCRPGATLEGEGIGTREQGTEKREEGRTSLFPVPSPLFPSSIEERTVGSVAAVCCRVPLADFTGPQAEEHFRNPVWVVQRAFAHGRVIETVNTRSPVLPLHFGTVFASHEALIELLSRHHETVTRFLDEMVDMHEWTVRGFIDLRRAEDWLLAHDPELAEKHRQLPESPGTRFFREKQLRLEARNRIKELGTRLAEELEEQMRQTGLRTTFLSPRDPDEAGQKMIFHAVCLIPGNQLDPVLARIKEIGAGYGEQGRNLDYVRAVAPLPFLSRVGVNTLRSVVFTLRVTTVLTRSVRTTLGESPK